MSTREIPPVTDDLERAANAMCAWLLEHCTVEVCEELADLHLDTWKQAAEVAIRAGRGEFDTRPFTMCPSLPR